MSTSNKQFMQRAKTALSDRWEKSHQKWLDEQKQRQEAQKQFNKYQFSLQLQTELAEIFSDMSAPPKLKKISFPSDLIIETNNQGNDRIYHFRWAKEDTERIPQEILNMLKDNLNRTILAKHQRLWNTVSTMPYPDNEFLLQSYPFTANGFRITACLNSLLDVELVIQT